MKILAYNYSFFPLSETFIYTQVKGLTEYYPIELVAYHFLNNDKFPGNFVEHRLEESGLIANMFNAAMRRLLKVDLAFGILTYFRLRRIIRVNKIDLIHAHFGMSAISILQVAKWQEVPLVVSFYGYDASASLRNKDYVAKLNKLFQYASAIVIVSKHMIPMLNLGSWMSKVHVIPFGIDVNEFRPIDHHNDEGTLRILHSGRLAKKKGVPDLIKVFSQIANKFNNVFLEILGEGVEMDCCRKLTEDLHLNNRIIFHGSQSQTYVRDLMNGVDIFVLNSREDDNGDMEGLPVSILEAMSLEKPVVSTRHAGIPDVITHEFNGLLVNEKSNEELLNALIRLIADSSLRRFLGKNARKTVLESFNKDLMINRLHILFSSLN